MLAVTLYYLRAKESLRLRFSLTERKICHERHTMFAKHGDISFVQTNSIRVYMSKISCWTWGIDGLHSTKCSDGRKGIYFEHSKMHFKQLSEK